MRCDDGGSRNRKQPVGAITDTCLDEHLPAEEILEAGTEDSNRAGAYCSHQCKASAARRFQIDIGIDIKQAHRFDAVAVYPALQRTGIDALVEVSQDDRSRVDPVGTNFHVIRQYAAFGIGQIAIHPDVRNRPATSNIQPKDTPRARVDRNDDSVRLTAGFAAG